MAQKSGPVALRFQHIDESDGLSNNNIRSIYKDNDGFLWFGTDDGLNRYDGSTFVQYRHDTKDSSSIAGDKVPLFVIIGMAGFGLAVTVGDLPILISIQGKGIRSKSNSVI